jgi:hypothetical protein
MKKTALVAQSLTYSPDNLNFMMLKITKDFQILSKTFESLDPRHKRKKETVCLLRCRKGESNPSSMNRSDERYDKIVIHHP